jgi:hypothetical protein
MLSHIAAAQYRSAVKYVSGTVAAVALLPRLQCVLMTDGGEVRREREWETATEIVYQR